MDRLVKSLLINRDPPTFDEVRGLAKIYSNSSELLRCKNEEMRAFQTSEWEGFLINNRTALIWTREDPSKHFTNNEFHDNAYFYRAWSCLLIDLDDIYGRYEGKKIDFESIEPQRLIKAYSSWHRALYDALRYESTRLDSMNAVTTTP